MENINRTKLSRVERTTKTADFDGATIDRVGYPGSTIICDVQEVGTAGGALDASNFWEYKLYHGLEDPATPDTVLTSSWAVVPADQLVHEEAFRATFAETTTGSFAIIDAATEDERPYRVGYIGTRRFLRVRQEATGSPGSTIMTTFHEQFGGPIPAV